MQLAKDSGLLNVGTTVISGGYNPGNIDPAILAYAQGLQGSGAPPAAPPPSAAVPPQPLQNYSAADIAAANAQTQAPISQAPLQVPPGMRGHGAPASHYRTVDETPLEEPSAASAQAPAAPAPATGPLQAPQPQSLIQPMRVLPAREVRAVSPATEKLYNAAETQKGQAAEHGEAADIGANEAGANAIEGYSKTLASQQSAMEKAEAERRVRYDTTRDEYENIRDEAARGEVKPEQVSWMGHIGMALGALGAGLAHTPNFAMEMIHKKINDDIAAQRANIENKNRAADRSRMGLVEMRERFGDERTAEAAERARQIEQAKAAGDVLVARAQSPQLSAKWEEAKAGLTEDQAKLHNQMFPWAKPQVVGGAAQKPLENVFMNVDGQRYQARDPESRKKLTASAADVQDLENKVRDYMVTLKGITAADRTAAHMGYTTDAMSRAQAAHVAVTSSTRHAQDDGVMKMSEVPWLGRSIVSPESFTGDPEAQGQLAIKQIHDQHNALMRTEDALPVTQQFVQNPQTGQLAPRNPYTGDTVKPQAPPASSLIREMK
jgi:hypothetical protein